MAAIETDVVCPLNDLSRHSYYRYIESTGTYAILGTLKPTSPDEENGKIRILLFAGPKVRIFRFVRLISFFLIVFLFAICTTSIQGLFTMIVQNNTTINKADQPIVIILLTPVIMLGLPSMLSLLFGFLSDYTNYQRVYLLAYSLLSSTLSALFLMLYSITAPPEDETTEALAVLSVVFYIIGLAMFPPIALLYGLDLLGGTSWEVKYLYFPMVYVVFQLAYLLGFVEYIIYIPNFDLHTKSVINFSIMLFALLLFSCFRVLKIFPYFDTKPSGFKVISFGRGIEIFWNALKIRCSGQKSPRGHWFIQLSSEAHYGKYPRKQVQMVASLFEIHFLFLFILFVFTISYVISVLFAKQTNLLYPPNYNITEVCSGKTPPILNNLVFIRTITIILCTPLIEYYFYNVIFYFNTSDNLIGKRRFVWQKVKKCLCCFDRYWLVSDPILKKIFWGSTFVLLSLLFAFSVEIVRMNTNTSNFTCNGSSSFLNSPQSGNYTISNLSIFSQVPQYIASGILEILSFIGCQQFVYFQSTSTYNENLLGHFFGLFFFYFGLSTLISSSIFYVIYLSCSNCKSYLLSMDSCPSEVYQHGWVPFVVFWLTCLVVIVLFAWFAHYRHYQLSKIKENFVVDEEG